LATYSTYLGLKLNSTTDPFLLSDFVNNWTILDGSPGVYVCTSSTRPNWTSAQAGRLIFQTDYECLAFWTGTAWLDCRDALPAYVTGTQIGSTVAHNTSAAFTVVNLTLPRACSLVVLLTATYQCPATSAQDVYQRVLVDGVGATSNQLGAYREQVRFSPTNGSNTTAGATMTSFQVAASVAPGAHTIGLGVDVGTASSQAVTVVGAKGLAFIAVTSPSNSL
jgi:hypothetical protein